MKRVLLVDDNTEIRENIIEMLELCGYTVAVAPNGKDGLEMAKSYIPDIILSDINMPELNGYEFFAALKKDAITKDIPFLFITSSVEEKEVIAAMKNGANGYIRKPFDEKDLMDALENYLIIL